jgi:serine/threonine protein phosphatase PrpC
MSTTTKFLRSLLEHKGISILSKQEQLLSILGNTQEIIDAVQIIDQKQNDMINMWNRRVKIEEVKSAHLSITNGTVGKPYEYKFDFSKEPLSLIEILDINTGGDDLIFYKETLELNGSFIEPGERIIQLHFRLKDDEHEDAKGMKEFKMLINPDPKSLWKNKPSDQSDPYWKQDNISASGVFGTKKLVVGSKRGRSHAHEGIFRDDDYDFKYFNDSGWGVISVADGAGSAKYSRKGALIACNSVISYFENIGKETLDVLSGLVEAEITASTEENQKKISSFCIEHIGKAAFGAMSAIREEAAAKNAQIRDYSTTLIFALVKEVNDKLFIASFWVGDGGIGIFSKEPNQIHVMGTPDSGEFSGQTRFLTMNEIFANHAYISRIKFKIVDKSSWLILMTDGITDPKFQTEAALEKLEAWNLFADDLSGTNEDNQKVDFALDLPIVEQDLMKWMDFWSQGNHDDRTIAILF